MNGLRWMFTVHITLATSTIRVRVGLVAESTFPQNHSAIFKRKMGTRKENSEGGAIWQAIAAKFHFQTCHFIYNKFRWLLRRLARAS